MESTSNAALRDLYEEQVRRNITPDNSGATVDHGPTFVRWAANEGLGWSEVFWTSLGEANADEAIAAHVEFYRSRGLSFMWGVYDYDLPHDLGTRLVKAGFVEDSSSTFMIAESSRIAEEPTLPDGVELVHVRDAAGVDLLIAFTKVSLPATIRISAGLSFGVCASPPRRSRCSSSRRVAFPSPRRELSSCPHLSSRRSGAAAPSRSGEEEASIGRRHRVELSSPPSEAIHT